jgi:hypothetical protein
MVIKMTQSLHNLAHFGNPWEVRAALCHPRCRPNLPNQSGRTALCVAAAVGNPEVVAVLAADRRVDPNRQDMFGFAPLDHAIRRLNLHSTVALLLADALLTPTALSHALDQQAWRLAAALVLQGAIVVPEAWHDPGAARKVDRVAWQARTRVRHRGECLRTLLAPHLSDLSMIKVILRLSLSPLDALLWHDASIASAVAISPSRYVRALPSKKRQKVDTQRKKICLP